MFNIIINYTKKWKNKLSHNNEVKYGLVETVDLKFAVEFFVF